MNAYIVIKLIHVVSSTVLFGTGLGIAFFKWATDRRGGVSAIRVVSERVVLADWIFTTPAIILQPVTGLYLAMSAGFPLDHGWLVYAIILYLFAGACWCPVVWLQIRMRDLARTADQANETLPKLYYQYTRIWFWLGVPAFLSVLIIFWLMVAKTG